MHQKAVPHRPSSSSLGEVMVLNYRVPAWGRNYSKGELFRFLRPRIVLLFVQLFACCQAGAPHHPCNRRRRWKIEDEGINLQKNSDPNLEHASSTDAEGLKVYTITCCNRPCRVATSGAGSAVPAC